MNLDPRKTLERAERAFSGTTLKDVRDRYRAIVGPTDSEDELVERALRDLRDGRLPEPRALAALERAIRIFRPAELSRDGGLPELAPEASGAFPDWPRFRERVRPHLYAVGRIDSVDRNGKSLGGVGTGFLLSETLLVTNRHVLWELTAGTGLLGPGQAVFNFHQEYRTVESEGPLAIERHVAVHPRLDLALLEVGPGWRRPERRILEISTDPLREQVAVVAMGYPFRDSERNPMYVEQVFGSDFGVKRAAPGVVVGSEDELFYHDCSTLGGNSGSPLLEMRSARVVGIHSQGGFLTRNVAVSAASLKEFVAPHLAGGGG